MTALLWTLRGAILLVAATLAVSAWSLRSRKTRPLAKRLLPWAWLALSLPLAWLLVAFLQADLSIFYVWSNTHVSYPWWLRIAGLWGGQAGTFLLWSWFMLGAIYLEQRWSKAPTWPKARVILLMLTLILLVPTLVLDLGQASSLYGLAADGQLTLGAPGPDPLTLRPNGEALNPLLESPYMAIHPAVEFLAYAMAAVPAAYGFVHLFQGGPFLEPARRWARASWLAFLAALTLGALWAYTVLSFGGYWIWDPVEVGNLLPFLALTLFLHAAPVNEREGYLGLLTPASAVTPFAMIVFADFVVRSGLWSSVHAFLPTGLSISIQDPTRRLWVAIQNSFQARYATRMMLLVTAGTTSAWTAFHARSFKPRSAKRGIVWLLAGLVGAIGVAGFAWPEPIVYGFHALAGFLGAGNPVAGVVVLVALAVSPLVAGLLWAPEETPTSLRRRTGQLVLASSVLAIALAATAVLLVLGVNGYGRSVFDARAPFVAGVVFALIALAFAGRRLKAWAWSMGGALGVGLVLRWVSGSWAWAAVPVGGVAVASVGWRFACIARPTGDSRSRGQVLAWLGAGVLGFVQWAWPGSVVVGGIAWVSPAGWVPVGLAASGVLVAAPFLERWRGWRSWFALVAGVGSVGYGVGVVLALVGWWLGSSGSFSPGGRWREGSVPLLHVGLIVLVVGTALSTYGASLSAFSQADPLVRGEPVQVGGYEVELVDGHVVEEEGRLERVQATVHVREGDVFVSEQTVALEHSFTTGFTGRGSFVPQASPVMRSWWGDLAFNADTSTPLAVRLSGGNETWVQANAPPPASFSGDVEAVSMGIKQLPGVNLLWGGVALVWVAAGARFWSTRAAALRGVR